MVSRMALEYALVQAPDVLRAYEIERAGFPEDEAASLDSLRYRQENASQLFLGAYTPSPRQLDGYVCGTLSTSPTLTHDSMSTHEASGSYVAIHSVCVDEAQRGKGAASGLLKEYLRRLEGMEGIKGARLIAHEELIPLYERAGFALVGKSDVTHGVRPWFEMKVDFGGQPAANAEEEEAKGNVRSPGRLLNRFKGGMDELVDQETGLNKADLFCPRADCRCFLLRRGTAKWVQGHASDFKLPALPHPVSSPVPPSSSSSRGYWSVSSPLAFENIGFSRNAAPPSSSAPLSSSTSSSAPTIKYLTCADCDHGPLGWHDTEGRDLGLEVQAENEARGAVSPEVRKGREFLLAVDRARYRV